MGGMAGTTKYEPSSHAEKAKRRYRTDTILPCNHRFSPRRPNRRQMRPTQRPSQRQHQYRRRYCFRAGGPFEHRLVRPVQRARHGREYSTDGTMKAEQAAERRQVCRRMDQAHQYACACGPRARRGRAVAQVGRRRAIEIESDGRGSCWTDGVVVNAVAGSPNLAWWGVTRRRKPSKEIGGYVWW